MEALRRSTAQEGGESQQQEDSDFQSVSFDEDDESLLDDPHSSPDSSPDPHSHARRLRQVENPVPVPEQQSPYYPGSEDEDHESVDTSSNKNLSAEKASPAVETDSGVDSTSV